MVGLEPRTDAQQTRLFAHLEGLHHDLVGDGSRRWAALLEHFFVVPSRMPASPRVLVVRA
jgi:hypothetical protein